MARKPGKTRAVLEYAGAMAGYALLSYLPLPAAKFLALRAADAWRRFDRRHARLAMDQMRDRLGLGEEEAARLVRANYRHYVLLVLEVCRLNRMPVEEVDQRTDANGVDAIMRDALAEGKGLIAVTGHLGNWEWGCVIMGRLGLISGALARPLDNPLLDNFVNRLRSRTGIKVWSKFGGIRQSLAALRKGEGFVAVADQDGGRHGVPAPFLGKIGSTMAMPVDLALHTGAPIFVGGLVRDGDVLRFKMVGQGVYRPNPDADPAEERRRLLTAMNDELSSLIRAYPEQWIWIHRRWRTQTG